MSDNDRVPLADFASRIGAYGAPPEDIQDRRGDQRLPWGGLVSILADDASFLGEKLGLLEPAFTPTRHDPLPLYIEPTNALARAAGVADIGRHQYPSPYVQKPEDDTRGLLTRGIDAITDPLMPLLYPDSIKWPDRERTRYQYPRIENK